jgi:N-acetylmuramoyl-L-alanine amidase
MGRIITWCRHCFHVISCAFDGKTEGDKNNYGECDTCKAGKGSWKKGGLPKNANQKRGSIMKIKERYLTPNKFSRPQTPLKSVRGIVIHWVANPKTTPEQNRNFFENLKLQSPTDLKYASAHFIIGIDGEVMQCLLENEVGFHVGAIQYTDRALNELSTYPNNCTLGIELCHPDWEGEFTAKTLESCKELILELCERYKLGRENIFRHYDVTGKDCPRYFVRNGEQWEKFLSFVFSES